MKKISIGLGASCSGSPFEQGREAAVAALEHAGDLPPALALLEGRGSRDAAEILAGARAVLGDCPLMGLVLDPSNAGSATPPTAGVRVLLLASKHLQAKVGVGQTAASGGEQAAREAYRASFVPPPSADLPEDAAERNLYRWYLYRRPSLALAAVIAPAGELRSLEKPAVAYVRRHLHGRVPLLLLAQPSNESSAAILAGERVITSGVVLTMIKTDLRFSLERFHSYEPAGGKLFVTRTEGDWVVECNSRPAIEAWRAALGLEPDAPAPFPLFPLAQRGRDGRFHLLVPQEVRADGGLRLPVTVEPDRALYPMKIIAGDGLGSAGAPHERFPQDRHGLDAAVLIKDGSLRDLPEAPRLPVPTDVPRPVEIPSSSGLRAFLAPGDAGGEAGHLLLGFGSGLEPIAVAAAENERLLRKVVQLKDLHQKIFDNIGYGIAVVDASVRIQFCNTTHRVLLAGSPAPLEGRVCPWSFASAAVCQSCSCQEAIARDAPVTREVVRAVEGATRSYRIDTFPLRDGAGRTTAAIEVMRDITAFKELRASLESEQRKMEAVIRGMGETLYIVGARYDLQFFHRGLFPVAAQREADLRGRICHKVLFRRQVPCPWCCMEETLLSGSVERRVAHLADEAGQERTYQVSFSPWGSGQGERTSVVCLLIDITAQSRLERQMVLSEKLNSLSILSAGMAHEMNNPLGAINFNLEILKRREKDEEGREVLESIRKDVFRINRIVGNLLSFSRSRVASSGWVSLPEVIDVALELFQVVVERRGIEVCRSYADGLPTLWGNSQDLQQVFVNLIANAVDAMPAGGTIDIRLKTEEQGAGEGVPASIAVVYDNLDELAFLRTLMEVSGWEVGFFRGDDEAIDSFRQSPATPPEVLIVDFKGTNQDRVVFFAMMVKEYAPLVRILVVADDGQGDQRWASIPGFAGVLTRPLGPAHVLERVRSVVDGMRLQRQRRGEIVASFADTGEGMPPDILGRIFDPFFTTKEARGTGLGLSVVHKILQTHGAMIQVSSSPGKGTVFTMRFPHAPGTGKVPPFGAGQNPEPRSSGS